MALLDSRGDHASVATPGTSESPPSEPSPPPCSCPSCPGRELSSFLKHKCHQVLCEDTDERLILPEEDFSGQHKLADVTGHTAGFQGDQSTHLPQLGHHHQDATAEGCANHLGGDSIYHCSLLFGYHQWFPRAPSSQHCVQFLLFFLNRKRT